MRLIDPRYPLADLDQNVNVANSILNS